jgi:hypothetical protein
MRTIKNIKILLASLLIFFTGSVRAEWIQISSNDDVIFFIDYSTIRKEGNFRKVWELQNLKKRHESGALSFRGRYEYDCKQERNRNLSMSSHSERFAGGAVILAVDIVGDWQEIPPDTTASKYFKAACSK